MSDGEPYKTFEWSGEHEEYGEYVLEGEILSDETYFVQPDKSSFPSEDIEVQLSCIEDAQAKSDEENQEASFAYDKEDF